MGNLYIVATPIGNLQDVTLRAAETLIKSDVIVAESISKADILIKFINKKFGSSLKPRIISLTEAEEENKIPMILDILETQTVSLVSEAGTPLISDPGFKLVREAIRHNIKVLPIPGASAPIAALSAAGLPSDKFLFVGFLPKKEAKREKQLKIIKDVLRVDRKLTPTVIIFESPHRIIDCLVAIERSFGNINIVLARELTKIHEEFRRQRVGELIEDLKQKPIKGEITLLFSLK